MAPHDRKERSAISVRSREIKSRAKSKRRFELNVHLALTHSADLRDGGSRMLVDPIMLYKEYTLLDKPVLFSERLSVTCLMNSKNIKDSCNCSAQQTAMRLNKDVNNKCTDR